MTKVTKTIGQLHFEDLDPKRFEDLVRQLTYDFRDWTDLEDTGKMGSDEGFDIRGKELINVDIDIDENDYSIKGEERIWLIQCKREKNIGPTKLKKYTEEITNKHKDHLYGFIFVASCHFSKKARDEFLSCIKNTNIQEAYLWDKSKLEDMLFQPKNDHLLFSYFGISITIRQKSLKSKVRNRLIPKRKLIKCLGDVKDTFYHKPVLIRNIEDNDYPYIKDKKKFAKNPGWRLFNVVRHAHNGIVVLAGSFYAYLDDNQTSWDYVDKINKANIDFDPWRKELKKKNEDLDHRIRSFWTSIPENNRAWLKVEYVIPYEKIIEIDEHGDDIASQFDVVPHLYVQFENNKIPFDLEFWDFLEVAHSYGRNIIIEYPKEDNKTKYFPDKFPKLKSPKLPELPEQNSSI